MGYSPWGDKESDTIEQLSARFGSTYTKIGTIQRRLAWPLCKDDTQIREAFHIFETRSVSNTIHKNKLKMD